MNCPACAAAAKFCEGCDAPLAQRCAACDAALRPSSLLDPIYDWFTEGFDTPELKDATVLLEELE